MREKLLYLVLQLVKTFSMLDGVQDDTVRECFDDTFELWMSIFVSALQGSIHLNLGIKKYIVKVSCFICRFWWLSSGTCSGIYRLGSIINLRIFMSFGSLVTRYCRCICGVMFGIAPFRSIRCRLRDRPRLRFIRISMMMPMRFARLWKHLRIQSSSISLY